MKHLNYILTAALVIMLTSFKPVKQNPLFDDYPVYRGNDLGVNYSSAKTKFKVWAPKASKVKLRLYAAGAGGKAVQTENLEKGVSGTWTLSIDKNLKNKYYTFQVKQDDKWLLECADIYAKAVGINGHRGMVVD